MSEQFNPFNSIKASFEEENSYQQQKKILPAELSKGGIHFDFPNYLARLKYTVDKDQAQGVVDITTGTAFLFAANYFDASARTAGTITGLSYIMSGCKTIWGAFLNDQYREGVKLALRRTEELRRK